MRLVALDLEGIEPYCALPKDIKLFKFCYLRHSGRVDLQFEFGEAWNLAYLGYQLVS